MNASKRSMVTAALCAAALTLATTAGAGRLAAREASGGGGEDADVPTWAVEPLSQAGAAAAKGDWGKVERIYAEVLAKAPELAPVRRARALALVKLGRTAEARAETDKALGISPTPEELLNSARVLERGSSPVPAGGTRDSSPYLLRAFNQVVAENYASSPDVQKLILVAELALRLDRRHELDAAVRTLERVMNSNGIAEPFCEASAR